MLGVRELSRARQDMGLKGKAKFGAERSCYCPLLNCSLPSQSIDWSSLVFSFGAPPSPGSSPLPLPLRASTSSLLQRWLALSFPGRVGLGTSVAWSEALKRSHEGVGCLFVCAGVRDTSRA